MEQTCLRLGRAAYVLAMAALLFSGLLAKPTPAQQAIPDLSLVTESLPDAFLNQPYSVRLEAKGGMPPYRWSVESGEMPAGLRLEENGNLTGVIAKPGDYRFSLSLSDSSSPRKTVTRDFLLHVTAPLELVWAAFPRVEASAITGTVKVSNQSKDDFDLTVIIVAVNEIGKAFALGYQRFDLQQAVVNFEIPFQSTLPQGSYVVHADAVAEIPAKNTIYRKRLQTPSPLAVTVGP
ncbi:MAG TPA: putative Ig domain-containing protein [Terriglobales bacterium]|nr:putative Ig domain-containing protein [Terriglobales bacterium]